MANKWIVHIKKTMKRMKHMGTYKKGLGLKQVIQEAKKSWHKTKKGGAEGDEEVKPMPTSEPEVKPEEGGRRHRSHKRTRRHRRH